MSERPKIPGEPVRVQYSKWDGTPHWSYDYLYLGKDEHGVWAGAPAGMHFSRPGAEYWSSTRRISYFPDTGWTPAFYPTNEENPHRTRVYIDITTVPQWRRIEPPSTSQNLESPAGGHMWEVSMVDLDLDVICPHVDSPEQRGRQTFIDDEDEFAEHQVAYGYPDDLVTRVKADTDMLLGHVVDGVAPFDHTVPERWFAVLDALLSTR